MIEKTIERAREMCRVFKCMIKGAKACVLDLTVFLFPPPVYSLYMFLFSCELGGCGLSSKPYGLKCDSSGFLGAMS